MNEHDEKALRLFERIMSFDTQNPPGNEKPLAEFIADSLRSAGCEASVREISQGRADVVARIHGGHGRPLVLCGHMDTVPAGDPARWSHPPIGFAREDGKVFGRGSSDMKSGLSAVVSALMRFGGLPRVPERDIVFFGTADEESGGEGARALLDEPALKDAQAIVIAEPTGNQISLASKGVLWLDFTVRGRASHAAYPSDGINAVDMAYELSGRINELCRGYSHEYLTAPTCTVTGISGGVKVNMVPDVCSLTLDVRTVPALSNGVLLHQIDSVSRRLCGEHPGLGITLDVRGNRPSVETDGNDPTVRRLSEIRADVCGTPTHFMGTGYFSDASVFISASSAPSMLFGPGIPDECHVPDEYSELEEYLRSVRCYEALIDSYYK